MNKVIELGKGNYDTKIDIKSSDEIGELATKFELMRHEVNKVNQEFKQNSKRKNNRIRKSK